MLLVLTALLVALLATRGVTGSRDRRNVADSA